MNTNLNVVPSWDEIISRKINCYIHVTNRKELIALKIALDKVGNLTWYDKDSEDVMVLIQDNKVRNMLDIDWFCVEISPPYFANENENTAYRFRLFGGIPIYEYKEVFNTIENESQSTMGCRTKINDNRKEKNMNNNMSEVINTFTNTRGQRTALMTERIEHKDANNNIIYENKTTKLTIPTITTKAYTINGTASTTCDESEFDERTGCLVACAKVIASKSEEANLMYQMAMKTWEYKMSTTILETLADRAVGGNFNQEYKKWKKKVAQTDKKQRTCKICGKLFETKEEARECEKAHRQRKVDKLNKYLERKEAMRIAKERLEKERKEKLVEECMERIIRENNDGGDASWF